MPASKATFVETLKPIPLSTNSTQPSLRDRAASPVTVTAKSSATNALTIDFEDWYQGLGIPINEWGGYEDRIDSVGRRLLDLLDEFNVRGTFFVLGYLAQRYPALVMEIARRGHEIGTHGYSHTLIYQQHPHEFREELILSIRLLQDLTGQAITGHRAPFFSINKNSLWALDILVEAGLRYDSSIFPVLHYRYGVPDAPRWPYVCGSGGLIELPPSTWRALGRNVPIAGGGYFRIFPYWLIRHAFHSINRAGHPVIFYLHPWEIDPGHPRVSLPFPSRLTHYANLKQTEGRLRKLLSDFRFAPLKDIFDVG